MCGICGIVSSGQVDKTLLTSMCDIMKHRGPDEEGMYIADGIGLGHRRLSIIDLEHGQQPIHNEDKSVWIVCNGEIYNFQELRRMLESKGHKFYTRTDTEVIVHLYEEYQERCLDYLRGMFAFGVWDQRKKRLFLARDRAGKKPLVYSHHNGRFVFASEIKAILKNHTVKREVDVYAVDLYLAYQYIPSPYTIFKDIKKLPPAHYLIYEKGRLNIEHYWDLSYNPKLKISEDAACDEILRLLEEATKIRLVSDVPVGVFLSGGLDSSAVVALMARLGVKPVRTFSIGFEESAFNELKFARIVAKRFGTEHKEFIVKPEAVKILPKLIWHYNEPFADSSALPTYYVAQMTSEFVKVILNGDGGDESFGGYERYLAMKLGADYDNLPLYLRAALIKAARLIPFNLTKKLRRFAEGLQYPAHQRYLHWISVFNEERRQALYAPEFLGNIRNHNPWGYFEDRFLGRPADKLLDRVFYADIMTYLPECLLVKMDIAAMANSLETRSPFLDHKVMEFAAKLPAGFKIKGLVTKHILKKAFQGILPPEILKRGKKGFGVPVGMWFRSELKDYLSEILLDSRTIKRGYFNQAYIKQIMAEHTTGRADHTHRLWALLNLELWHRMFIDKTEESC